MTRLTCLRSSFLPLDFENDFMFIDAATGSPCNPADGSPTCAPYSSQGGRMVFKYNPTKPPTAH